MGKNIFFLILGFMLAITISVAFAKYESGSNDAASVVGYGKYNGAIVPILVDSSGVLQTN